MINQIYLTFLVVAEYGSFSKAANQLFISPVSVMKQINKLEFEISTTLFHRSTHGVTLTKAGQLLAQRVRAIQKEAQQAINDVQAAETQHKVAIKVGASMMRPATRLINLWQNGTHPQLNQYDIQIVPISDNDFSLQGPGCGIGEQIDCVVSPYDAQGWYQHYQILKLGMDKFKLAVPLNNPLAHKQLIHIKDLNNETIITPARESPTVNQLCNKLIKQNPTVKIVSLPSLYTTHTFIDHANELVLTRAGFQNISPTFRTIDVEWNFYSPSGLVYSKHPSAKVVHFIDAVKKSL